MDPDRPGRPSPIEQLPVELVQMVLSALPDVNTLRVAALSCPAFYRVFVGAETAIATAVLLNQTDINVLPEAMLAMKSLWLQPREVMDNFGCPGFNFFDMMLQRLPPPGPWALGEALRFVRLPRCVNDFAQRFAAAALAKDPACRSRRPATRTEMCRIKRAFYRFEVYCNLVWQFGRYGIWDFPSLQKRFFDSFAPWENEQVACIHDFLVRAISPAFSELTEYDRTWGCGVQRMLYGGNGKPPYIQQIPLIGLKKLHQFDAAMGCDERLRLLADDPYPFMASNFFRDRLRYYATEKPSHGFLDRRKCNVEWACTRPPRLADPDVGPRDVWRWAHEEESWGSFLFQDSREDLREWGYVMWDRSRLDNLGILLEPWQEREPADVLLEE